MIWASKFEPISHICGKPLVWEVPGEKMNEIIFGDKS